jgi:hypothetical protein
MSFVAYTKLEKCLPHLPGAWDGRWLPLGTVIHITLTLTYTISCQLELRSINSINNAATTVLIPFLPALLELLNASETANRLDIAVFDGIGT